MQRCSGRRHEGDKNYMGGLTSGYSMEGDEGQKKRTREKEKNKS
jgi:hypothetical protein